MTPTLLLALALGGQPVVEPGGNALPAGANPDAVADLGFDQRLDAPVPLDLTFRDEAGRRVTLGECAGGKPTILVLAYYRCPQLCTLVLNGLIDGLRGVSYSPGEEFNVVTVSFDPRETPEIAAAKKAAYLGAYGRPGADAAWHFLTGDAPEIEKLASAVGFRYSFDAKNDRYNHASGVVVLTPDGKVSRYLFGLRFAPRDLKLALLDASAGKVGSPADQFLLFCFQYDHAGGKYALAVMNLMRAAGAVTVVALGVWMVRLTRRPAPPSECDCMTTLADIWPTPENASTFASRVDALYYFIIGTTVAVSTLVAVLVIYFAIRYHRRSEDEIPKPIVGSHVLEITWSAIPLVIVMVMFGWSAWLYMDMSVAPADALEVYVTGKQWMWKVQHPDGQREINELHVPVGQAVKLTMTSEDVIHSFFVPDFRTKQDVIPGRYTSMWFQATKPGRYRIYCAEYCGTDHSKMVGWVVASEPADHQQWLSGRADLSLALRGRSLFLKYQCVTCHTGDSQAKAPNLEAIYLQPVRLADGKAVVADESYLRESILNPRAKVAAGFEPIMPAYQGRLEKGREEQDLLELLAYIKALRKGETPSRNEYSTAPESDPKATDAKPYEPK